MDTMDKRIQNVDIHRQKYELIKNSLQYGKKWLKSLLKYNKWIKMD